MTTSPQPTYLCLLTPPGVGALATLCLIGPDATGILRRCFVPKSHAGREKMASNTPAVLYGTIYEPAFDEHSINNTVNYTTDESIKDNNTDDNITDDNVINNNGIVKFAGHESGENETAGDESGEDESGENETAGDESNEDVVVRLAESGRVELHCHGGTAAVSRNIAIFQRLGAVLIDVEQFNQLTEPDPIRRQALQLLPKALTWKAAAIILDQYNGALTVALSEIKQAEDGGDAQKALELNQKLHSWNRLAEHLTRPCRVVLTGPPNVGKSSLLNRLVGYTRAIINQQPGTTRDVVEAQVELDGWMFEITDTAGIRITNDPLELEGVHRARNAVAGADLILNVSAWNCVQLHNSATRSTSQAIPVLEVVNKIDLEDPAEACPDRGDNLYRVSAYTGEGMGELVEAIVRTLIPVEPPVGEPVNI